MVQQARLAELVAQLLLIDSVEELDLVAYLQEDLKVEVDYLAQSKPVMESLFLFNNQSLRS